MLHPASLELSSFDAAVRRAQEIRSIVADLRRHVSEVTARVRLHNAALEQARERLRRCRFEPEVAPRRLRRPQQRGARVARRDRDTRARSPLGAELRRLADDLTVLEIGAAWIEQSLLADEEQDEPRSVEACASTSPSAAGATAAAASGALEAFHCARYSLGA